MPEFVNITFFSIRSFYKQLHFHTHVLHTRNCHLEKTIEQELTAEEKAKLYKAIKYQKNELVSALPKEVSANIYI